MRSAEEDFVEHYRGPECSLGPVNDDEIVLYAVFGDATPHGHRLSDKSFEDRQLRRTEQSLARHKFTSSRDFERFVGSFDRRSTRAVTGISRASVAKLREIMFKQPLALTLERAVKIVSTVKRGDHYGHAAVGYTVLMQELGDPQKKKIRPLVRLDLAAAFSEVLPPAKCRWRTQLGVGISVLFAHIWQYWRVKRVIAWKAISIRGGSG